MLLGGIGTKETNDMILFEVADGKIFTFSDFTRSNKVRFSKSDVLLKKPVSEYIGPDLDNITFKISMKAEWGVNPRQEMDKLIHAHRNGELVSIVVGKLVFGVYRWRICDLTMSWERVDNQGDCVAAGCDLTFEEYV